MESGSERKALEIVHEAGGETTSHVVSRKLGIDTGYARLLCMSLARKDYLDLKRSGRFRITFKGEKALDKTTMVEEQRADHPIQFKRQPQERIGWQVLSTGRIEGYESPPAFDKSGQDELIWHTVKVDGSGRHFSEVGKGIRVGKLLAETSYPCGFCKGSGGKPKGTVCSVCRGSGEVKIDPPALRCAYCKGRGEERPRSNVTCTVCRGKGFVSVKEPMEGCTRCRGRGAEPNNKLPCLECGGKGVVSKTSRPEVVRPKVDFYRQVRFQTEQKKLMMDRPNKQRRNPTASETEVLEVYYESKRQKIPLNVSNYTGMSPAYVDMMGRSLVENGFLVAIAPRKYEITPKGIKFLQGDKNRLKASVNSSNH
ncbi:MAG: hypothetical protein ABIL06_12750 [Pseudomonadota bacterium]